MENWTPAKRQRWSNFFFRSAAELGQAASAVGSKVYLTGGVSFGQLAYVPTPMTESSIAVNTTSYIPLYADAFSEIMSLKLGISLIGEAKTAFTKCVALHATCMW